MTQHQDFLCSLIQLVERAERDGLFEAQRLLLPVLERLAPRLAAPRPALRATAAPAATPPHARVVQLDDYRARCSARHG